MNLKSAPLDENKPIGEIKVNDILEVPILEAITDEQELVRHSNQEIGMASVTSRMAHEKAKTFLFKSESMKPPTIRPDRYSYSQVNGPTDTELKELTVPLRANSGSVSPVVSGSVGTQSKHPSISSTPNAANQGQTSSADIPRSEGKRASGTWKAQFLSFFQPSDNKLAMKLFGTRSALLKERKRQQQAGQWIIHPCSNFRYFPQ